MFGNFTTDSIIADIKRRAMIPTSDKTFATEDFLAFINSELKIGIVPYVLNLHEEYYVYPDVVALEASKSNYAIPYRAIGGKLRDLFFQDTNGNLFEMSRIPADDKAMYQQTSLNSNYIYYYLEGNSVVLVPEVGTTATGNLVFSYFIRPNDLVDESRVAIITAISTSALLGTTTYTVDEVPTGFSTSITLDLLQAKPGHKIRKYDVTATNVNAVNKTITFDTDDIDDETEVGDHISFSGECIIPQCPTDLHTVLTQRAAARCLEALGDTQGLTNANSKLQEMELKSVALIDNRVEGSVQKVVNNRGLLRSGRRGRW